MSEQGDLLEVRTMVLAAGGLVLAIVVGLSATLRDDRHALACAAVGLPGLVVLGSIGGWSIALPLTLAAGLGGLGVAPLAESAAEPWPLSVAVFALIVAIEIGLVLVLLAVTS